MIIDIRKPESDRVDAIIFGDDGSKIFQEGRCINIRDGESSEDTYVYKYDVDNLIKALQKAKELGWLD